MKTIASLVFADLICVLVIILAFSMCEPDTRAEPLQPGSHVALVNQAAKMVWRANSRVSVGRQMILAEQLATIAEHRFQSDRERLTWFALVGIESAYDGRARSATGAVGLGQLIPTYYRDFGASCGLGELDERDIMDDYTNLTLSACYFGQLLRENDGSIEISLVAYNQGPNSKDVAARRRGHAAGREATDYVTKVTKEAH